MLRGTGKQRQHKGPVLRGRTLCREGRASRRLLQGQGLLPRNAGYLADQLCAKFLLRPLVPLHVSREMQHIHEDGKELHSPALLQPP